MAEENDIMISYHPSDQGFVLQLRDRLRSVGFSVWCMDPEKYPEVGSSSIRAKAIVQCKICVTVLSTNSAMDPSIKDELSLAYVSNKSLYPLGLQYYGKVAKHLDAGMKLILAKINWTFFAKADLLEQSYENFIGCLKQELEVASPNTSPDDPDDNIELEEDGTFRQVNERTYLVQHPAIGAEGAGGPSPAQNGTAPPSQAESTCVHTNNSVQEDFWRRHFGGNELVTWADFRGKFLLDYESRLVEVYGSGNPHVLLDVLHRDVFSNKEMISLISYNRFVGTNHEQDPDHFCERVKEYVKGRQALKDVLGMDSSVRLTAVENICKFQTPAVISILFDLVEDEDPNMRAISVLALAKTGRRSQRIEDVMIALLQDVDRVVRESACLSLAHIRCERATAGIIDLWRNDAIKHVREAAEIALHRIGGTEAAEAIKMTGILQGEMQSLKDAATSS